jgi:putative oxidoreductase
MNLGLLLLRTAVGLTLAAHGSQKLFGWFGGGGLAGTGQFFEKQLRFRPGRTYATMAALTEFGAGLLLALGFLTPAACAGVIGVMMVAGTAGHAANGFFITKGGYEYTFILGAVAASVAFTGPGRFSLDRAIGWNLSGPAWGVASVAFGVVAGACVLALRDRVAKPEDLSGTVEGGREAGLDRSAASDRVQA